MTDQFPELTLDDARKLYEKFAGQDGGDAVRVMAQIALWGKWQQVEVGRLRLLALRQLGRFLIRNGRSRGRPAKMSSADVLPTLVGLGITDRHISADSKSVARISQKDFDDYLTQEDEPTLKGLLRFAEHTRTGQPYPKMGSGAFGKAMQAGRSFLDTDDETSTTEWYTPPEFFEAMETDFDLDVCSPGANIVPWIPAKRHLTKKENGLVVDWHGFVWMNSPYGMRNGIAEWIEKFVQHGNGVAIAPDFTSTEWWHALTEQADIVMFARPKRYISCLSAKMVERILSAQRSSRWASAACKPSAMPSEMVADFVSNATRVAGAIRLPARPSEGLARLHMAEAAD